MDVQWTAMNLLTGQTDRYPQTLQRPLVRLISATLTAIVNLPGNKRVANSIHPQA